MRSPRPLLRPNRLAHDYLAIDDINGYGGQFIACGRPSCAGSGFHIETRAMHGADDILSLVNENPSVRHGQRQAGMGAEIAPGKGLFSGAHNECAARSAMHDLALAILQIVEASENRSRRRRSTHSGTPSGGLITQRNGAASTLSNTPATA